MSTERFSDPLGLLNATGRKVYFLGAVTGCEVRYSFSHFDVGVASRTTLAPCLSAAQTCSSSAKACPAEIVSRYTKQKRGIATRLLKTVSMGCEMLGFNKGLTIP